MLTTYGVLGTGSTSKNVIEDALNELGEDNDYLLDGPRKLSASEVRVYEWMCDHEVSYIVIHNDNTSEDLLANASHTIRCKALSNEFFLKELKKRKGTLLLLWDDDRVEEMEQIVFMATDLGIPIKDLTNGLSPIVVEGEDAPKPTMVPTEEVEIDPFGRPELEGMPISVLRKTASGQGVDTEGLTKAQLINAILGEIQPATEKVAPTVPDVAPVQEASQKVSTTDEKNCMATIVLPNGTIVSLPITMAEARTILGLG